VDPVDGDGKVAGAHALALDPGDLVLGTDFGRLRLGVEVGVGEVHLHVPDPHSHDAPTLDGEAVEERDPPFEPARRSSFAPVRRLDRDPEAVGRTEATSEVGDQVKGHHVLVDDRIRAPDRNVSQRLDGRRLGEARLKVGRIADHYPAP
jgi:hypothetical protein